MISHLDGNPHGPSLSFFFSCGPVGCSGTLVVAGFAGSLPLPVPFCVCFSVEFELFVFASGCARATPVAAEPSSHGCAFATAA